MALTQKNLNQSWDPDGNLVEEEEVEIDVTVPAVHYDLHGQLRRYLDDPPEDYGAWLAALTRLLLHADGASDRLYDE